MTNYFIEGKPVIIPDGVFYLDSNTFDWNYIENQILVNSLKNHGKEKHLSGKLYLGKDVLYVDNSFWNYKGSFLYRNPEKIDPYGINDRVYPKDCIECYHYDNLSAADIYKLIN